MKITLQIKLISRYFSAYLREWPKQVIFQNFLKNRKLLKINKSKIKLISYSSNSVMKIFKVVTIATLRPLKSAHEYTIRYFFNISYKSHFNINHIHWYTDLFFFSFLYIITIFISFGVSLPRKIAATTNALPFFTSHLRLIPDIVDNKYLRIFSVNLHIIIQFMRKRYYKKCIVKNEYTIMYYILRYSNF